MRVALLFTLLFAVASCTPFKEAQRVKKCAKYSCVQKEITVVKDSIVFKDTTIYITQKGNTEYIANPCAELCDSFGKLKEFRLVGYSNGIRTVIRTVNDTLIVECDVDSLKSVITGLKETHRTILKQQVVEVARQKSKLEKFQAYVFWGLISFIVAIVGLKYFRIL